jgi:hypothetical protein
MSRRRWHQVRRTLLLSGVVLALALPVGPASAAPSSATAAKLPMRRLIVVLGLTVAALTTVVAAP